MIDIFKVNVYKGRSDLIRHKFKKYKEAIKF